MSEKAKIEKLLKPERWEDSFGDFVEISRGHALIFFGAKEQITGLKPKQAREIAKLLNEFADEIEASQLSEIKQQFAHVDSEIEKLRAAVFIAIDDSNRGSASDAIQLMLETLKEAVGVS